MWANPATWSFFSAVASAERPGWLEGAFMGAAAAGDAMAAKETRSSSHHRGQRTRLAEARALANSSPNRVSGSDGRAGAAALWERACGTGTWEERRIGEVRQGNLPTVGCRSGAEQNPGGIAWVGGTARGQWLKPNAPRLTCQLGDTTPEPPLDIRLLGPCEQPDIGTKWFLHQKGTVAGRSCLVRSCCNWMLLSAPLRL